MHTFPFVPFPVHRFVALCCVAVAGGQWAAVTAATATDKLIQMPLCFPSPGKLESKVGVLEDTDGTVYILPSRQRNFSAAQDYCAKIPRFQLITLKTRMHYLRLPFFNKIAQRKDFVLFS